MLSINPEYQYKSKAALKKYISQANLTIKSVIDVGANVGLWAHWFIHGLYANEIHCFEPKNENFECLIKNCQNKKFHLHPIALGDCFSQATLYQTACNVNCGDISLVKRPDLESAHQVKVRPLDSYLLAPDLIKIDVQGFEPAVLLGAEKTILAYLPVLCWEKDFSQRQVESILSAWGYRDTGYGSNADAIWHI